MTNENTDSQETSVEEELISSKWIKTRQCGCGECRFYTMAQRPECPSKTPRSPWLFAMNPVLIGQKDYFDPFVQDLSEEIEAEAEVSAVA